MPVRTPRAGTVRLLAPVMIDMGDPRITPHVGHKVEVTQPFGCPKNGTMGHLYVNCLTCSPEVSGARPLFFIGLVAVASLVRDFCPADCEVINHTHIRQGGH